MPNELHDFSMRLKRLAEKGGDIAEPIVEHLADVWVTTSKRRVRYDTGQTHDHIDIESITSTRRSAQAVIMSTRPPRGNDGPSSRLVPGLIEYGTRYMSPRPYMRDGRDAAEKAADQLGGRVRTSIERVL